MVERVVTEPTDVPEPENLPEESVDNQDGDKPNLTTPGLTVGDGNEEPSRH